MDLRRIKILPLLLIVSLLISGCTQQAAPEVPESGSNYAVYYASLSDTDLRSTPYVTEKTGEEAIRELFTLIQSGSFSEGHPAVPQDVVLDHIAWQEACLVLYLTGKYPKAGTAEEILCRAAIVRTLTCLPEVEGVSFYVDDEPLKDGDGTEVGIMSEESFLENADVDAEEAELVTVTLYFANARGDALTAETMEVAKLSSTSLETLIMERLIEGPKEAGHKATLPANTAFLTTSVKENICYVNFDSSFLSLVFPVDSTLSVYSIVNSLTELENVDKVQLTVDGTANVALADNSKLSFAVPFERNMSLVEKQAAEN